MEIEKCFGGLPGWNSRGILEVFQRVSTTFLGSSRMFRGGFGSFVGVPWKFRGIVEGFMGFQERSSSIAGGFRSFPGVPVVAEGFRRSQKQQLIYCKIYRHFPAVCLKYKQNLEAFEDKVRVATN